MKRVAYIGDDKQLSLGLRVIWKFKSGQDLYRVNQSFDYESSKNISNKSKIMLAVRNWIRYSYAWIISFDFTSDGSFVFSPAPRGTFCQRPRQCMRSTDSNFQFLVNDLRLQLWKRSTTLARPFSVIWFVGDCLLGSWWHHCLSLVLCPPIQSEMILNNWQHG